MEKKKRIAAAVGILFLAVAAVWMIVCQVNADAIADMADVSATTTVNEVRAIVAAVGAAVVWLGIFFTKKQQ